MFNRIVLLSVLMVCGCSTLRSPATQDRVLVSNHTNMTPIHFVVPEYPETARHEKIEGWALVEFTVAEDGRPENIQVVASEPETVFDKAAIEAAGHLVYVPLIKDGQLVAVSGVQYRYVFDLLAPGEEAVEIPEITDQAQIKSQ